MKIRNPNNKDLYLLMHQIADLLQLQHANLFRINAFRSAAEQISKLPQDLKQMVKRGGTKKLVVLPAIGDKIANIISNYAISGQSRYLNRLHGDVSFEHVLEQIPGIGPSLAKRILRNIHVSTLEELELAVYDGRLDRVPGFGRARLRLLKMALEEMLGKQRLHNIRDEASSNTEIQDRPSAGLLLELDAQYHRLVKENKLKRIAPKRFNPTNKSWLPIFHTERIHWHFTILYSNTALAHQLNKHKDWVIIYFHKDDLEGQATIVTETKGPQKGKRVVRGREEECMKYYSLAQIAES